MLKASNKNRFAILMTVIPIVLVAVYALKQDDLMSPEKKAENKDSLSPLPYPTTALSNNKPEFVSGLENLPQSLRGTQLDGELLADEQGNLIINHDVRTFFDYFLTSVGEEPIDVIRQRIQAYIRAHLTEPAASQAIQLLEDYLELQAQVSKLKPASMSLTYDPDFLADRLQTLSDLRRTLLSHEVANAFFGEDEAYDRFTIEAIRLSKDSQLSAADKTEKLKALEAQLPEEVFTSLKASQQLSRLEELNQQVRNRDGDEQELYQLRTELVGSDAAQRLAQLDVQRLQWQQRLDAWLDERQSLLASAHLSETDMNQLLTQMRMDRFEQRELVRVKALEKIHDQKQ